ncbi:MAG: leucine-rich repeat domain-containing protein, partial [Bacteroidales bacterium]|nr:leucine-rich repeat domain-containing protein [Bacteroidales bacterium]
MKKQLLFLLFALLALCASAEPNDVFSVGDITYSVILDSYSGKPGIVAVKRLSAQGKAKTSLKLDIPGVVYYSGYKYKVRGINYDAFKGQSNISVVQIRYNITRIAQSAFENCTSLTTVYLPSSLTNVEYHAFWGCNALKSVYYANPTPTSNSVITNAFPDNTNMTLYVSKAHTNSVENARKVQAFDYFSTIKKHVYASDFILSDHGYFCVTKAPLSDGSTRGEMSLVGVYADDNLNSSWSGAYNDGIADFDVVEIADSACLGNTGIKSVNFTGYSKLRRVG